MDHFWKLEKRLYSRAPEMMQNVIRTAYVAAYRLRALAMGEDFRDHVATYASSRGMDFYHNIHDWLGGYPYETAVASEVERRLIDLGFQAERIFAQPLHVGIFGSGCNEYVYRSLG
jgi:hypothetical protein